MIINFDIEYLSLMTGILLCIDLIFSLSVAITFVYKLYYVNKKKILGLDINLSEHKASLQNGLENKILDILTKYTILAVISASTSTIWIITDGLFLFLFKIL